MRNSLVRRSRAARSAAVPLRGSNRSPSFRAERWRKSPLPVRLLRTVLGAALVCSLLFCFSSCQSSVSADPFGALRGDFDAEIRFSPGNHADLPGAGDAEQRVFCATVSVREGCPSMTFTAPESLAGITVMQDPSGGITVRRGRLTLTGTAFGSYLAAARLLTETGPVSDITRTDADTSVTYLAGGNTAGERTRTMSLSADGFPLRVTDPGLGTVTVVWFEPVRD